jgi:hypothetical protein
MFFDLYAIQHIKIYIHCRMGKSSWFCVLTCTFVVRTLKISQQF